MKNSAKYLFGDHLCACPTLCIPKIDKELITLIIDLDKNVNSFRMLFTFVVRTELINKMIFLALDYFKSNTAPLFLSYNERLTDRSTRRRKHLENFVPTVFTDLCMRYA